jgi:hypothetical protein
MPPAWLLGNGADTKSSEDTGDFNTPPKPATGPTCIGSLHNCPCPRCHIWSRQTAHGKPIPITDGVMEMDSLGRKNIRKAAKSARTRPPRLSHPFEANGRACAGLSRSQQAPERAIRRASGRTTLCCEQDSREV